MKFFALILLLFPVGLMGLEIGELVEVEGVDLELKDGTKVVLIIEDNQFVGYPVDAENKLIETEIDSILIKISNPGKKNDNWQGALKASDDGSFLIAKRRVFPPFNFHFRAIVRFADAEPQSFHRVKYKN